MAEGGACGYRSHAGQHGGIRCGHYNACRKRKRESRSGSACQEQPIRIMASTMHWLEHRIPPPVIGLLAGAAMWAIAETSPRIPIEASVRIAAGMAFVLLGGVVALLGGVAFRRARTTVNPLNPEAASSLVVSGIYRYTRNPMYVGFASMLAGWAVYLAAPLALLGPIAFVLYITRFQIIPEERVLSAKFGPGFAAYQARVRRWL